MRAAVRQAGRQRRPAVLYLHPWEIDPDQPRLPVSRARALRHYRGLAGVERKLRALLARFPLGRMDDLVAAYSSEACSSPGPSSFCVSHSRR